MLLPTGIVGAISTVANKPDRRRSPRDPSRDGRSQKAVRRHPCLRRREFQTETGSIAPLAREGSPASAGCPFLVHSPDLIHRARRRCRGKHTSNRDWSTVIRKGYGVPP